MVQKLFCNFCLLLFQTQKVSHLLIFQHQFAFVLPLCTTQLLLSSEPHLAWRSFFLSQEYIQVSFSSYNTCLSFTEKEMLATVSFGVVFWCLFIYKSNFFKFFGLTFDCLSDLFLVSKFFFLDQIS